MTTRKERAVAQNKSCLITRTRESFEFFTGYRHEVYDREQREILSQWEDSTELLEKLDEDDHRLYEEFKAWYEAECDDDE